jgi:hypothetical protein
MHLEHRPIISFSLLGLTLARVHSPSPKYRLNLDASLPKYIFFTSLSRFSVIHISTFQRKEVIHRLMDRVPFSNCPAILFNPIILHRFLNFSPRPECNALTRTVFDAGSFDPQKRLLVSEADDLFRSSLRSLGRCRQTPTSVTLQLP